jgi:cob(I)alamin adenosyltransferase
MFKASADISIFGQRIKMEPAEINRLALTIESLYSGNIEELPSFIIYSSSEGLSKIAQNLIETNFLKAAFLG